MIRFTYACFVMLFCITSSLVAQNKQLRSFSIEDGLPQSQVNAMAQDSKGYLWAGTQGGGLARFDGKTFEVFDETNGLSSNYVAALYAQEDSLFIGTSRGLSVKVNKEFINRNLPSVQKISPIGSKIYVLTSQGIYALANDLTLKKISLHPEIDNLQVNDLLYFEGFYWIATQNALWKTESLSSFENDLVKISENNYVALLAFNQKVYASTFDDGTLTFYPNNFQDALLIKEPLEINSLSIQNNNQLWVATQSSGISVLDTETYEEDIIAVSSGLTSSHVTQVLKGKQANIWIATAGGGLYNYSENNFKHFDTDTGLKGNQVYAVHYGDSAIWASNAQKGLVKIDDYGVQDIETPRLFYGVKIKTIASDNSGGIWSGSDGRGVWYRKESIQDSVVVNPISLEEKSIPVRSVVSKVFNTENGFPDDWIRDLQVKNDTIYAATYSSGIVKYTFDSTLVDIDIHKVYKKSDGIEDVNIIDLVADDQNRLWYSTQKGHLGYIEGDKVTHLGQVLDVEVPINTILFDKNNTLFIGTAGKGIWWSDDANYNTFKKLSGPKPIDSENIYQLIFDDEAYLWAGTERGVNKLELDADYQISDRFFFGQNDGFLGIETCLNAVAKDPKGHLWFGAIYGLTEYQPSEIRTGVLKPGIFLEDVKIAYESIDTIDFSHWVNSGNILKLKPEQRQISFTYKTVDIDNTNGVEYQYKLNDNAWSPWSSTNTQNFSELDYGNYTFSVRSRNHRWKTSDPINFSFFIERPLIKKTWVQLLLLGLAILILAFIILQYIRGLKRRNKDEKQRLELENHLLTLEQKALRLQMNPHFIFNVLNGIKAMAKTKPDKMNETVNSFAMLLRETLVNSRKDSISLAQEIKTLRHYIEVEQLMASKPFKYDITLDLDVDAEEILLPSMLIQPFVENAIRHGILKGSGTGKLNIAFKTTGTKLSVKITDNGIGIYTSQQQQPKTDHQSMALKVTKERLVSVCGEDNLKIEEIKLKDGRIGGTSITFELPLETDF